MLMSAMMIFSDAAATRSRRTSSTNLALSWMGASCGMGWDRQYGFFGV